MWAKIDDGTPDHPKFAEAGAELDGEGLLVAFGFWAKGLCYSNKHLTDGFLPTNIVKTWSTQGAVQATRIAAALVGARLWEKATGGYRIHDYHDHNPHADEVRARKEQDRIRKENERRAKLGLAPAATCPVGIRSESDGNPAGQTSDTSGECPSGIRSESDGNPEPRARAGSPASDPVPSRPVRLPSGKRESAARSPRALRSSGPNPKTAAAHATCSACSPRLCVPMAWHDQKVRALGADGDQALRGWYPAMLDALTEDDLSEGNVLKLLDRKFTEWRKPVNVSTDGARQRAIGPTYANDWYADCHHDPKCETGPMHRTRITVEAMRAGAARADATRASPDDIADADLPETGPMSQVRYSS